MPKMSKQARAREFNAASRRIIKERDRNQCIFCQMQYHMEDVTWSGPGSLSIMHYIPRSRGGLGIPQNGAQGCVSHHEMLDNGNKGRREEMLQLFRTYLQDHYPDWSEDALKSRTISKIIRMTPEEKRRLEYCAEKMAKTETEILIAGVNNYYAAVQKALAAQKNQ